MDTNELIAAIEEEIDRLLQVKKLLFKGLSTQTQGRKRKKRILSAEARDKIAAAQRKRWALQRKAAR
jgi:hypothetical protein